MLTLLYRIGNIAPILLMILLFSSRAESQLWRPVAVSPLPEKVSNNAVVEGFISDVPYVFSFGGIDSTKIWSGLHLRSYRYNNLSGIWDTIPPLPDPAGGKIASAASRIGDTIFITGGYHVLQNGNEISSAKVHRYLVSSNSYLPDGTNIPVPIDDHVQAVWRDSLIYIITGWSNTTNVANVQIYNPAADSWLAGTPVQNNSFYKAFGAAGVISGDTIFYYGGAAIGTNFPSQSWLRKGIINPEAPTEITWSVMPNFSNIKGYRMAATSAFGRIHWIGGSAISYNFDGIAYNGSGGVPPINRNLYYQPESGDWDTSMVYNYPMDLRGIANTSESIKYLAGGMQEDQKVTNQTWKLIWEEDPLTSLDPEAPPIFNVVLYPNPSSQNLRINFGNGCSFPIELRVYDPAGQLVLSRKLYQQENSLNLSFLPLAEYILEFENENMNVVKKLILGSW